MGAADLEWNEPVNAWFALAEFSIALILWAYGLFCITKPQHLFGRWVDDQSANQMVSQNPSAGVFKRASASILYSIGTISAAKSISSIRAAGVFAILIGTVSLLVGLKTVIDLLAPK